MKVVAINGSPHKEGNTYAAIKVITDQLEKEGIETEILHVGTKPIRGCTGCWGCGKTEGNKCIYDDDIVNEYSTKMMEADGIILGCPVHYSGISGTMKCFLDRAFYSRSRHFAYKIGATVAAVRRSGGTSTFHQLNNYLNLGGLIITPNHYWTVIHGGSGNEVLQDGEGVQIMETVGKNMAWLLKTVELGKQQIEIPEKKQRIFTNFIR